MSLCLWVVLFCPPPATPAARGRFLMGDFCLVCRVCVSFNCFSSRVPGSIARPLEVWEWVLRSRTSTHGLVRRTGVFPNLPYFCICDSSGWASVKIPPRKACNYPNLRSFGWVSYDKVGVLYSGKLGNRSEALASDLRSYPGLWWNRIKLRLYEDKESEYSSRTCSTGRPAGGPLCPHL